ncbi:hypothetical protein BC937DRAFT_91930 [Endogone sp. FLAS-F59071]|nr:hypothetical protein BC937DRAFT_91930 [Endogone sp. FLAS-F59071]|eukprot:RUS21658.1 hypothetical protein BC937DRAFT_91930 [Endogone sp. FLAS-F59071]
MAFDLNQSEITNKLIQNLTGIKESDLVRNDPTMQPGTKNFELCVQFAESNYKYHRSTTINERDTENSIKGLVEKFRIKGRDAMADMLEALTQRLFTPKLIDKKSLYSRFLRFDILALLLSLSEKPLATNYIPSTTFWARLAPPKPLTWEDIVREEPLTGEHWSRPGYDSDEDDQDNVTLLEDFELELDANGLVVGGGLVGKKVNPISFSSDVSHHIHYERNSQLRKQKKKAEACEQNQQQEYDPVAQGSHYHKIHIDFESPVDLNVMQVLSETQYWRKPLTDGAFAIRNRDDPDFSLTGEFPMLKIHEPCSLAPALITHQSRDHDMRFLDPGRQHYLDEVDAIREVLFMLRGHAGVLFDRHEWDVGGEVGGGLGWEGLGIVEGMFTVNPRAIVRHLTESALKNILFDFCDYGNWVTRSRELVRCLCTADPTLYGQTCQAFASALNEILVKFEERIAGLETEFTKFAKRPEGKDMVVSLLKLRNLLSADLELFRLVGMVVSDTLVLEAASTPPSGYPPISPIPPARLTISLLTGLYDQVVLAQFTGQQESFAMLRRLFDCSFEPYGRMIDQWIFEGSVEVDCADEFFVIRNIDVPEDSPQYWQEGFCLRFMEAGSGAGGEEFEADDIDQKSSILLYPSFLEPFAAKILFTGKAVNMLLSLKLGDVRKSGTFSELVNMQVYSNTHMRWDDMEWTNAYALNRNAPASPVPAIFTDGIKDYAALTTANFPMFGVLIPKKSIFRDGFAAASRRGSKRQSVRLVHPATTPPTLESVMSMARESGRENDTESHKDVHRSGDFSLYHQEFDERLDNYVRPQYESAGRLLAHILKGRCDLTYHFRALAGIYLMLEGDLMHRFCQMVFRKIDKRQAWYDSQALNGLFMEACRHTEWERQDNVHIWVKERENLQKRTVAAAANRSGQRDDRTSDKSDNVHLNSVRVFENVVVEYRLPWPINNIIRVAAIHQYKRIITLLLELKRAKYLMERISLFKSRLHQQAARGRHDPAMLLFYSLRVRLMWFVNTVYNYIMTTILHSETQEFQEKLTQVFDIDEIIQLHEGYVRRIRDRCLLNEKVNPIMRAIILILDTTIRFSNLFARYVEDPATKSFMLTQQSVRILIAPRADSDDDDEGESEEDDYDEAQRQDGRSLGEDEDKFWTGLNGVDHEFRRASEFVTTTLRVIARNGGFPWCE